jgi:hypothetical protein
MNHPIKATLSISCFVIIITFGLISACAALPTPTASPTISNDKAIEIAVDACKTPDLVLVGQPKNMQTKLLTLEAADELTRAAGEATNYGIPMDTLVWLVQMDGQLQLVGGPAPVVTGDSQVAIPTPPQPFWGTCSVILDAGSGAIILVRG